MKSRRQRDSKAPAERPTYRKILDQAVLVLNEDGFDRFSVQRVLDGAEVSRATLYRHFPDVDGLIEMALVETFRQVMDVNLQGVVAIVENSQDVVSFRDALSRYLGPFSLIPPETRLRRVHTFALAPTRPGLAAAIAAVQEALTDGWDSVIQECQRKGFVRQDVDSRAAAVIIQSMAIGRIVDDAAATHVSHERWAKTYFEFVDRTLINPDF